MCFERILITLCSLRASITEFCQIMTLIYLSTVVQEYNYLNSNTSTGGRFTFLENELLCTQICDLSVPLMCVKDHIL